MKKKNNVNLPLRKVELYTKGEPCKRMTEEESKRFHEMFKEMKLMNKVDTEENIRVTEHEYYDYYIKENELIENYEECSRLLKLKNETPYSDEKTMIIRIIHMGKS